MLRSGSPATLYIATLVVSILLRADSVALAMYEPNRNTTTSPTLSQGNISETKYVEVLSIVEIAPIPDRLLLDRVTALRCTKTTLGKEVQTKEERLNEARKELRTLRRENRGTRPGEQGPTRAEKDRWKKRVSSLNSKVRELRSAIRLLRADFHRTDRELKQLELTGGSTLLLRLWDGFNHTQITAYFLDADIRSRRLLQECGIYEVEGLRRRGIRDECKKRNRKHESWHWNELTSITHLRDLPEGFWPADKRDELMIPSLVDWHDPSIVSVEARASKDPDKSQLQVLLQVDDDDPAEIHIDVYANDVDGKRDKLLTTEGPLTLTRGPAGGSTIQTRFDPGTRHPFGYSAVITSLKVWRSKEW